MATGIQRLVWLNVCCNILLLLSGARGLSTKGTEFFFAFMGNDRTQDPNDQNAKIFVTTEETQPVQVTVEVNPNFYLNNPNLNAIRFPQTLVQTVVAGTSVVFEFSVNASMPGNPFPAEDIRVYDLSLLDRNSGIRVSTDGGEISVYAINNELASIDTFSVYPCHTYPTIPENAGVRQYEYVILSASSPLNRLSRLLVVGCEDNTSITIIPDSQLNTIPATVPIELGGGQTFSPTNPLTFSINRLQTYLIEKVDDLTGSRVTSTQPIALFGGHECAEINAQTCDHIVQQLPPEPAWGKKFFILPVPQRYSGEHYRAATTSAETSINVTCRTLGDPVPMTQTFTVENYDSRLNTGWIPFNTRRATSRATRTNDLEWCCVESSTPILLMQYSSGSVFDETLKDSDRVTFGDPFMAIVPPIRQYSNDFTVPTAKTLKDSLFASITIAVPQSEQFFRNPALDQASININGEQFTPDEGWVEIFCSSGQVCGYGGRLQSAPEGTVTVRHGNPLAGISVLVYGIGASVSFGYNAGFNLDPIAFPDLLIENVTVNEVDGQVAVRIKRIGNIESGSRFLLRVEDQSAISLGPDDEIDYFLNYTINPPDSRVQDINETTSELRMRAGVSEITITFTIQVDSRAETTEIFLLFLTGTRRVNSLLTPVGNVTILDTPLIGRALDPSSSLTTSSLVFTPTPSPSAFVPSSFLLFSTISSLPPSSSLFRSSVSPTPSLSPLFSPPFSSLSTFTLLFPAPSSISSSLFPSSILTGTSISPSPSLSPFSTLFPSPLPSSQVSSSSIPPPPSSTPSVFPSSMSTLPSSPLLSSSPPVSLSSISPTPSSSTRSSSLPVSPSPITFLLSSLLIPSSSPVSSSSMSPPPSSSPISSSLPLSPSPITSLPSSLLIPSSSPVSSSSMSPPPFSSPLSSSLPLSPSPITSLPSSLLIPSSPPVSTSSMSPPPSSSPLSSSLPLSPSPITSLSSSLLIPSSQLVSTSPITSLPSSLLIPSSPPASTSSISPPPSSFLVSSSPLLSPSSITPPPSLSGSSMSFLSPSTFPSSSLPSLSRSASTSPSLSALLSLSSSPSSSPTPFLSSFPLSSSPGLSSTPFPPSSPSPSPIPPEIGMGDDPHFSILLPTEQMLCFSVHGEKGFSFNLISNKLMHMNALFTPDPIRDEVTWIGSLGIVVKNTPYKMSNVTKLRFEVQEKKVYIGHDVALSVVNIDKLIFSNGKLRISETSKNGTEKIPEVTVYLKDVGLSFRVQYQWRHLDLLWDRVDRQPNNSHGIIGQFFHDGIEIDEVRKLLILPGMPPVPVMRRPMWSFMEGEVSGEQMCWVAMTHGYQGKGLIQGHYLDYLVEDVLSGDFKYRADGRRL